MTGEIEPRFDIDALRDRAGDVTFERGTAYHRDGLVEIQRLDPDRVLARVVGTEDYRIALTGIGASFGGECSCPAYRDQGFCKHMVATALAANAAVGHALSGEAAEFDDTSTRIRRHLRTKGVESLVELVMELAVRDPILFSRLDLASAAEQADDRTLEARVRKAIDTATRTGHYIDYAHAAGWAREVEAVLDSVADLASGPRAAIALRLAGRALDRVERALDSIDDSGGHAGWLLERAAEIHLAAALASRPDPSTLARDLFDREVGDGYGTFGAAALRYAEALGSEGLAEYRRLAEAAWAQLPPTRPTPAGKVAPVASYDRLMRIVDYFAERDGDVEARITLRTKDLSRPWDYLRLAEFCLDQGREALALERALEGLWMFEDGRVEARLVYIAVDLLLKAGRSEEAEAQLRRAFEKSPSIDLYVRLRKLGGAGAYEWATALVAAGSTASRGFASTCSGGLLVEIHMHEKNFDAAWVAAGRHRASPDVRLRLARASEATHPAEASATYARRIDELADAGGNAAYAEAAKLVADMARLQDRAKHVTYLLGLKQRYRRKRNFMKLLG